MDLPVPVVLPKASLGSYVGRDDLSVKPTSDEISMILYQ